MANYMSEVAKMLGVELGERFNINFFDYYDNKYYGDNVYYLCDDGIKLDKDGHACSTADMLLFILCGKYTIKRKPWKPNFDEEFYVVQANGSISRKFWDDCTTHYSYYKLGNCYRTVEDAKADKEKLVAFYNSDEVLEVCK